MTTTKRETWIPPQDPHGYTELFTNAIRVLIIGIITVVIFGAGYMVGGAM